MKRPTQQTVLVSLFLCSVFLLALCEIEDTDAWTHLSFGKLIWQLKGLPPTEPFIYTSFGRPFAYGSWLFGFLYYASYVALNIYGVILLKAFTITAAFAVLLKDSLQPFKNHVVSITVMAVMAMMMRFRFVDRPDIFMMLFLALSIFSLNAYVYDNKKYLLALPFIHMLWANIHPSINLMFVPFIAFIGGGLVQRFLARKGLTFFKTPSSSQIKTIALIFAASFAASLVSPYFTGQYSLGTKLLSSPWLKQEITEMLQPSWQTDKRPYFFALVVLISFVLTGKRFSFIHAIMMIPFIALSFTAVRFIFLAGITAGPVMARNFSSTVHDSQTGNRPVRKTGILLVSLLIIGHTALSLLQIKPFADPTKRFGFGINTVLVPEGALRYMDRNGIKGRILNKFEWGGYITWRDFPERSAFIDGRGYLPGDLLEKAKLALHRQPVLDDLEKTYGFESVLISYPIIQTNVPDAFSDIDVALYHPQWALVYWDDRSLLYVKRGGPYDSVIRIDAYRFVMPAGGIESIRVKLHDKNHRSGIIRELKRNIQETGSSKAYALLGAAYNETGLYREAIDMFSHVRDLPMNSHIIDAYNGIAFAHANLGHLDEAVRYYKKSLHARPDAAVVYAAGTVYMKKGDKKTAAAYLRKAVKLDPSLVTLHPELVQMYRELGMESDARKFSQYYEDAQAVKRGEEYFKKGIRAFLEKRNDAAIREFKKSIEANPFSADPYCNIGYIYFEEGRIDMAYEYLAKAIEIEPRNAKAHYWLAELYKKRGDSTMARKHWREYLSIEPTGYYSRRALESIESREHMN